jgi:hypothetical protein
MVDDPELQAMVAAYDALKNLDSEARERALSWLIKKLAPTDTRAATLPRIVAGPVPALEMEPPTRDNGGPHISGSIRIEDFQTAGEFIAELTLSREPERVLAVSAFLQKKHPEKELTGFTINSALKNLGYGKKNITAALAVWIDMQPQCIIQIGKGGKSQQAKKTFKVTEEGLKLIMSRARKAPASEQMLPA